MKVDKADFDSSFTTKGDDVEHLFASEVSGDWEADTFFPPFETTGNVWRELSAGECPKGWASDRVFHENCIDLRFLTVTRLLT